MTRRLSVLGLVTAAVLSLAASSASATVYIGLQQDAGPIVTVASSATGFGFFAGPFGEFEMVAVTGLGQPGTTLPIVLQTTALASNVSGNTNAGVLTVYVTSTGNTAPLGAVSFTSGFATVNLTPPWTETLESYLDPGNGVYALTTALGSAFFNTVAAETDITAANTGAGPYSVTVVYRITAPSFSSASSTAGIAGAAIPVPEPASLALLGAALIGFGVLARRLSG
jgi:hypothetical protein